MKMTTTTTTTTTTTITLTQADKMPAVAQSIEKNSSSPHVRLYRLTDEAA
jgi:hypothetical protein